MKTVFRIVVFILILEKWESFRVEASVAQKDVTLTPKEQAALDDVRLI